MASTGGVRDPGDAGARFRSIVVALDLESGGDRALPVARSLAEQGGIPVELLTVSSPNVPEDIDTYELKRRARDNGWPDAVCTIVHDDNPARGIVDHLNRRDGALLVMAADTRPLRGRVLGNIGEEVLRTASGPVVLVGPALATDAGTDRPSLDVSTDAAAGGRRDEDRNPAEVDYLDAEACWQLLRSIRVGRLAVCVDRRPLIFPVNYVVDGTSIVFRTAPGTKLAAARDAFVGFEIDDYDARSQTASSVVVSGRATEIADDDEWDHALGLPLFPWDVVPKSHFVRIDPDEVSGRRFRAVYAGPGGQVPKRNP